MKRILLKYSSEERECEIKLTSRSTKHGDVFYMVEYGSGEYAGFSHLSSALDFINTNFGRHEFSV